MTDEQITRLGKSAAALAMRAAALYVQENRPEKCACPVFVGRLCDALKASAVEALDAALYDAGEALRSGAGAAWAETAFKAAMADAGVRAAKLVCEVL